MCFIVCDPRFAAETVGICPLAAAAGRAQHAFAQDQGEADKQPNRGKLRRTLPPGPGCRRNRDPESKRGGKSPIFDEQAEDLVRDRFDPFHQPLLSAPAESAAWRRMRRVAPTQNSAAPRKPAINPST